MAPAQITHQTPHGRLNAIAFRLEERAVWRASRTMSCLAHPSRRGEAAAPQDEGRRFILNRKYP